MENRMIALIGICYLLIGCSNSTSPPQNSEKGSLALSIVLEESFLQKTIEPDIDMAIETYNIIGVGPDNIQFMRDDISSDTVFQASLDTGHWDLTVGAKNKDGTKIGEGQKTIEILPDSVLQTAVLVTPLEGTGILEIEVSWVDSILNKPSVTGTITPKGGSDQSMDFLMADDSLSAVYQNTFEAGYYKVVLNVNDGSEKVWGRTEAARIVANGHSTQQYNLSTELNKGSLLIVVTEDMEDPITVTLNSTSDTLIEGSNTAVNAITNTQVEGYQWYLNGEVLPGENNSSVTFGANLLPGIYWLDVLVNSGEILSSNGKKITVMESQGTALSTNSRIIFLHHSTGENIWNGGVPNWFTQFNTAQSTNYQITEQAFPKRTPYGWKNDPYDYWNIWVNNAGDTPYLEEPTLEILTQDYEVIVWKNCYVASDVLEDIGVPDITSNEKRVENYKLQYQALKAKMHEFPDNRFVVWVGPAYVAAATDPAQASRAGDFYDWVRNQWDEPDDNIYLWDFRQLETEGGLYMKDEYAVSTVDSHPNATFSATVAPFLGQRIVDVIQGRGETGSRTGQ